MKIFTFMRSGMTAALLAAALGLPSLPSLPNLTNLINADGSSIEAQTYNFHDGPEQDSGAKPPAPDPPTEKKKDEKETKWDVEGDHGPSTIVEFDTDEGTWMNLDVSPDGSQ